jgi:uncharacterized cupin superfamily protein
VPVNIFKAEITNGKVEVGTALGSERTTMSITDIAPGRSSCPYHYEYVEEWLLVVDGTLVLRAPDGEHALAAGDLLCFPPGPAGAHKLMNRSETTARTLMFSSARVPAVSVYPDSEKIGIWTGNEADDLIVLRSGAVPYDHGEEGWENASDV